MANGKALSRSELTAALGSDPLLLDFLKPLPSLLRGGKDLAASFDEMAKRLAGTPRTGVVQVRLTKGRRTGRCWSLAVSRKKCEVMDGEFDSPAVELITSEQTWSEIASGQTSPLEAFVSGNLRVRGDLETARSVVRRMHKKR